MPDINKYINKNGDVAVLISNDYGAGWSTWNSKYAEAMAFDPEIVKIIMDNPIRNLDNFSLRSEDLKRVKELASVKYPEAYLGGIDDGLSIEWLKPGTDFLIHEYDGSESIWTEEDMKEYVA